MQPLHVLPLASLLALGSGSVAAETLYNQDGVQLSATVRSIDPGAATCRVREERHTTEQYEELKPNEGQPLNVWRVDLEVANYTGKALDYLNAHLNVGSDWPPCDHWDGPEGSYGKPIVWTGPLMSIQDVGTVEPGEEVRETAFVLAWHEEEPALGRWDIDYDFAAAPPVNGAGSEPPARQADDALSESARAGSRFEPEETCAGKAEQPCWVEIENQPGCHVWLGRNEWGRSKDYAEFDETVTWSGGCSNGLANGVGELVRDSGRVEGPYVSATGELSAGMKRGHWTERTWSGRMFEGSYVAGKRDGRWLHGTIAGGYVNTRCYSGGDYLGDDFC